MIFNSLFSQIVLAVLAIGLAIVYIQPTFERIGAIQDAIAKHQTESANVVAINQKLADMINRVNNISASDQRALLTYLPDKVDYIAVSRDIYNISQMSGVEMTKITYNENQVTQTSDLDKTDQNLSVPHTFSASVTGSYDEIKAFLLALEQNNYPLEVRDLSITASEEKNLNASLEIVTYSSI